MGDKLDSVRLSLSRAIGRRADLGELALVAPVACVVYEAVFLTRYVSLLPDDYDPTLVWPLIGCVAAILACVFFRRRHPLGALLVACACAAACAYIDQGAYTGVPLLVLLYGVVARASLIQAAAAVIAMLAAFWAPVYLAGEETLALVHLEWVLAVVAGALVSRALWTRRQTARELEEERSARERVTRERDEAEVRSRIAGELHDSVGHDLTAIIALTEGLMGTTGDDSLSEAVESINRLAREGLADTRRAVRQLSALHGDGTVSVLGEARSWDDARPVLECARSTGLAVAFTETGTRLHDHEQADLVFSVTREAVTNALRHARQAHRITVAWDHADDGSCAVIVRDDGVLAAKGDATGTGLARLRGRLEAVGGRLDAGPSPDGGWEVRADVPCRGMTAGTKGGQSA
ncbi:MAG: histidine kinase [Coriobacteriaceae bacterium]|nr:histidine kinase [Coriobacteriaceae bacterium]MCI7438287.1 histidine kinase [Coriobacteriaceae bacterium]MDD7585248.1 histidine kinase [Coriobacteriaceae bacterium]